MESNKLLRADYLDIIFDGKNKAYGGYELRRKYADRASKATLAVMLGVAITAAIPFIADALEGKRPVMVPVEAVVDIKTLDMPKPEEQPPVHIEQQPAPPTTTIEAPVPRIVTDNLVTDTVATVEEMSRATPSLATSAGPGDGPDIIPTGPTGGGSVLVEGPKVKDEVLTIVDIMPEFQGDLLQYLQSHLRYPEDARMSGEEGRVGVQFVVNEDGSISNATVINSATPLLDKEAVRVVSGMPKWKPGKQSGKAVKVYFKLPVSFTLN